MINDFIKKLRKAADILEDLLSSNPLDNPGAVKEIHKSIALTQKKGFRYKGKHWTQLPENRAKIKAAQKKAVATRLKNKEKK